MRVRFIISCFALPDQESLPGMQNIALSFLLKKATAGKDDMKQKALMRHRAETVPGFAGHIAAASEQNIHPSASLSPQLFRHAHDKLLL